MDGRPTPLLAVVGAVLALGFGVAGASPAGAASQGDLPQDNSGLDQYIESLPAAGGDRPPSGPSKRGGGHGSAAELLRQLPSSSGAGAPPSKRSTAQSKRQAHGGGGARAAAGTGDDDNAAKAAASTVFDSDHPGVAILAAGLLVLAVGGALLGIRLRRGRAGE